MAVTQVDTIRTQVVVEGADKYQGDIIKSAGALDKLTGAEDRAAKSSSALSSGLKALAAAGVGMALSNQLRTFIQSAAQMEQFQAQFEVLLGSTAKARSEIELLYDFAAKTPFDLPGVIEADRLIKALGVDVGGTERTLRLFGDAASAMGRPMDQVVRVMAKLKAGMFDMAEMAPLGITRDKLKELGVEFTRTGEVINRQDLWPAAIALMEQFAGTMEKVSATTGGKLTNLEDSIGRFNAAVGKTVNEGLRPMLDVVTSIVDVLGKLDPALLGVIGVGTGLGMLAGKIAPLYFGAQALRSLNIIAGGGAGAAAVSGGGIGALGATGIGAGVVGGLYGQLSAYNMLKEPRRRWGAWDWARTAQQAMSGIPGLAMGVMSMHRQVFGEDEAPASPARRAAARRPSARPFDYAAVERTLEAERRRLAVIEAQTKIAGYRSEKESQTIPAIERQVAAMKQYEQTLRMVYTQLPKTEDGEKERAKAAKELLSTTVERESLERKIRDLVEQQAADRFKERQFLMEVQQGVVERAADRMNRDRSGWLGAAAARGSNPFTLADRQTGWAAREALLADQALAIQLGGGTAGEKAGRIAELQSAYAEIQMEKIALDEQLLKSELDLVTANRDMATKLKATDAQLLPFEDAVSQARRNLAGFYARRGEMYGEGTPERMASMLGIQGLESAALDDKLSKIKRYEDDAGKTFADAFTDRMTNAGANLAKAFTGEIQQMALNAPAGFSEMLPSFGRLGSMSRPRGHVMNIQLVVNGGRREILDEFTRILDTEVPYEAGAYAFSDGE